MADLERTSQALLGGSVARQTSSHMSEDISLTDAVKLTAGISLTKAVKDVAGCRDWFFDEVL